MIISDIKKTKHGYHVYIDQEIIHLEMSVFLDYKLKKNQTITLKQFRNIIKDNEIAYIKRKSVIYVARSRSVRDFKVYLRSLNASKELIEELTTSYKQKGYLNDQLYAQDLVHRYEHKYGKTRLKAMLIDKGIHEQIIDDTLKNHIDKNVEFQVKSLCLTVKKENYQKTKETIQRRLINLGYDIQDINTYINKYLIDNFDELSTIKPHYERLKRKFNNYDNPKKHEAITNALLRRGYRYETIKKVLEEV